MSTPPVPVSNWIFRNKYSKSGLYIHYQLVFLQKRSMPSSLGILYIWDQFVLIFLLSHAKSLPTLDFQLIRVIVFISISSFIKKEVNLTRTGCLQLPLPSLVTQSILPFTVSSSMVSLRNFFTISNMSKLLSALLTSSPKITILFFLHPSSSYLTFLFTISCLPSHCLTDFNLLVIIDHFANYLSQFLKL